MRTLSLVAAVMVENSLLTMLKEREEVDLNDVERAMRLVVERISPNFFMMAMKLLEPGSKRVRFGRNYCGVDDITENGAEVIILLR